MKVIIYILCIAIATFLNELLGYLTGFKLGSALLIIIMLLVSKKIYSLWDKHTERKKAIAQPYKSRFSECSNCGYIAVFEKECPKCGYIDSQKNN